jgi:hypothetical protein
MPSVLAELNGIVQEVLGGIASKALLGRIAAILADGSSSREGLIQACTKVEKMVNLFIGADKAQIIGKRFRETLARTPV